MFAAIAFDLDNTLIDRDAAARNLLATVVPPQRLSEAVERDASGYEGEALFEWLACKWPELGDADAVARWFRSRLPKLITHNNDVVDLVARFAAEVPTALVTNGGAGQRRKLARAGLAEAFDHVAVSAELGFAKPDPRIFAHTVDAIGVEPKDVLFVGDHPINDIAGAAGAGMRTCWVSHQRSFPLGLPRPDFTVERLC